MSIRAILGDAGGVCKRTVGRAESGRGFRKQSLLATPRYVEVASQESRLKCNCYL